MQAVTPRPPKQRFTLHPAIVVVMLIMAALMVVGTALGKRPPGSDGEFQIVAAVGAGAGVVLWPVMISVVAFWLGRRSVRAANIAASIVMGLIVVTFGAGLVRGLADGRARSTAAAAQVDATIRQFNSRSSQVVREYLEGGNGKAPSGDLMRKGAADLRVASRAADKETIEICAMLAGIWEREADLTDAADRAVEDLLASGGLAITSSDPEALDARVTKLVQARRANLAIMDYLRDLPSACVADLRARGVRETSIAEVVRGMKKRSTFLESVARVRACDEVFYRAAIDQFDILRRHSGNWEIGEAGVVFGPSIPEATISRYNELADSIDQALADQQAAQQEMLRHLDGASPSATGLSKL